MLRKNSLNFILVTLCLVFLYSACTKEDYNKSTVFNLRMTDDPLADVQQVNIDLQSIVVITDEGKDSIDIGTNTGVYNLLDYQGNLDTLIGSATISSENIYQIRLVLGPENTIMVDSALHDMKTPSAEQSGLKILINENIANLDTFNLLIDFDAEESVVKTGGGDYILKPVIKVVN